MKQLIVVLCLLIASDIYAQKVLPFDVDLEDSLINHMVNVDASISAGLLETKLLKEENQEQYKHEDVYCEPVEIFDLINNRGIELNEINCDFGMYVFWFPMQHPSWSHIFLKYHGEVIIIEDDLTDNYFKANNGQCLINQVGFLTIFFKQHQDIPRSYFPICVKLLMQRYDLNRTTLE